MKKVVLALFGALLCLSAQAQPRYDMKKIQRERLGRGVVAVKKDGRVHVLWRILRSDKTGEPFEVYRNGEKLTTSPLTKGGAFFTDEHPLQGAATYEVRGGGINGSFTIKADAPEGYIAIPIEMPQEEIIVDTTQQRMRRPGPPRMRRMGPEPTAYNANDASVGDADGDGEYEIFLKWDPRNSHDNAHAGYTNNTYIDCIKLDGTRLWRINLGRNIRSGAHYVPFLVYDFDGDGRAELMVKTADGTVDGRGRTIGDASKDWRNHENNEKRGRILDGPEYLTVFSGTTGEALATVPYEPDRGTSDDWGDDHGNRSERYLAAVAYLDGIHPSAVFCRGYYTRTVLAAWDWNGTTLTKHWVFDTKNPTWMTYAGQGNHNLRVADVDADGKDEIVYGSMCVDHDGMGLYNTRLGHGDAIHLTAFDPKSDRLQVWDCHENRRDGSTFRDAATGEIIFQLPSKIDVGRCLAADIDPTNPGVEMWSSDSKGIRNIKGELIHEFKPDDPDESARQRRNVGMTTNFAIWWDGDLLRELLDHEKVLKFNWKTGTVETLQPLEGSFNNGTKSNPCLSADLLGDWREEVLMHNEQNTELRLYITDLPTDYRINCLMEDIPYRLNVAAENVGYNQPPETGFYLGPDEPKVPFLK